MAKKSKHATGKAFSVEVCDAIRHHIAEGKALDSKRDIAFDDRDEADGAKRRIQNHESDEYLKACRRHSEAISLIMSLDSDIKWHRNQIKKIVEKADDPQLDLEYAPPVEPVPAAKPAEKPKDSRPVGVPDKRPELKITAPEGKDEHLNAPVSELGLSDKDTDRLIAAGRTTIRHVIALIDADGGTLGAMQEALNVGQEIASRIRNAVGKFRKQHRSAMVEVERDAQRATA